MEMSKALDDVEWTTIPEDEQKTIQDQKIDLFRQKTFVPNDNEPGPVLINYGRPFRITGEYTLIQTKCSSNGWTSPLKISSYDRSSLVAIEEKQNP